MRKIIPPSQKTTCMHVDVRHNSWRIRQELWRKCEEKAARRDVTKWASYSCRRDNKGTRGICPWGCFPFITMILTQGGVYYANYLKYFEEARSEYMSERGLCLKDLTQQGILFVVVRQETDYKAPAFYQDTLEVMARLTQMRNAKLEFEHEIKNEEGRIICTGKALLVRVDKDFKPKAISMRCVRN